MECIKNYLREHWQTSWDLWSELKTKSSQITIVVTFVVSILAFLGIVVPFPEMEIWPRIGLGLLLWLGLIVFIITPYRLWKVKSEYIKYLTEKKLTVDIEETGEVINRIVCNHLIVHNCVSVPISSCYGQLISFKSVGFSVQNLPPPSVVYPWSTNRGGSQCRLSDIAARGFDYLDILYGWGNLLHTPVLAKDNWTRNMLYPVPAGSYQLEIQVGSETENIAPTRVILNVSYSGGTSLKVEKVKEYVVE